MARFADLSGRRFGSLTVLRRADDYISPTGKKTVRWLCHCDACGRDVIMLRNVLTRGVQSCGCRRGEKLTPDLAGKKFGKWTVLQRDRLQHAGANGTQTGWLCRCECGTERVVLARSLTSGSSKSCGCDTRQKAKARMEEDNVLGRYQGTVVSAIRPDRPANKNSHSGVKGVYWSSREERWIANIVLRGKKIVLGRYKDLEDARKARLEAEDKYYMPIIEAYDSRKE